MSQATKQDASDLSRLDNAIETLEGYALILEAIKALGKKDEVKALKAMIAVSRGLKND